MIMQFNFNDRASIIGGTAFSILPNIPPNDLIVTMVMAFVGALVSFLASMLFKYLAGLFRKPKE